MKTHLCLLLSLTLSSCGFSPTARLPDGTVVTLGARLANKTGYRHASVVLPGGVTLKETTYNEDNEGFVKDVTNEKITRTLTSGGASLVGGITKTLAK